MSTMPEAKTAVAVPLSLLESETITVLTDSFQAAFLAAYDEEQGRKKRARVRLLAELAGCDPFRNSTAFEEYRPE